MEKNKALEPTESRGKESRDGKNFRIPISNGIFEHYERLKDARWLLDLFVDWTTKEVLAPDGSRDGIVLGGKPIRDEDTARAFRGQCSTRTTRRWRQRLARFGYISQKRTPLGYVITVKKSKKWAHSQDDHRRVTGQNCPVRPAKNGRSELPDVAGVNYSSWPIRTIDRGRSNKDSAVQDTDVAVEEAASAFSVLKVNNRKAFEELILAFRNDQRLSAAWGKLYGGRAAGESLSVTMERCIQECKIHGVRITPPFYTAKRAVENLEADEENHLPRLVDPDEGQLPRIVNPD